MRHKLIRTVVAGVSAAVAVGVVAIAGDSNPVQDVRLLSGAAWFSSSKVGQLTLLDGASAEVSAQVQVAPAGNLLEVVQQGSTAYAVDQSAGTVRRVDGTTFDITQPQAPIPDARTGLTAVAGPTALYTLDTQRGILASTDPRTLTRRGEMISVASRLTAGTATVDDDGTLWTIDTATGELHRVAGEIRTRHPKVAQPGQSTITIANGHPVVIDRAGRKATSVQSTTGSVGTSVDLDIRDDDTIQVSGSPHKDRLYVIAGRGVLSICDLTASTCDTAIPLTAGNEFGAAVETANRLFVPNYTTGEVWIVDLGQNKVVAKPAVLQAGKFQLLTRDGVVFYNDVQSEKAGVIHLDGTFTPTAKYDPADPDKGVKTPPNSNNPNPGQQQTQSPPQQTQIPTRTGTPQDPDQPQQPNDPNQPPKPPDPNQSPEPRLKITMSDTTPTSDQPIELTVENTNGSPVRVANWTFGDGNNGTGASTSHRWAAARETPYQVTVSATMADDQQAALAVAVVVSDKPTFKLTVQPPTGGTITGNGINCPGTCTTDVVADTVIELTAVPDSSHRVGTWTGCTSTTNKCSVTMTDANKTVSHAFTDAPPEIVTLRVTAPANGRITGGAINCPGTCTTDVQKGTDVTLTATASDTVSHELSSWGGACSGRAATCRVSVDADNTTVSAAFVEKPKFIIVVRAQRAPDPPGDGTVSVNGGTPCETNCAINVTAYRDEVLVLKAKANPREPPRHFYFSRWEGGAPYCGSAEICNYTVTGNAEVTGYFKFTAA